MRIFFLTAVSYIYGICTWKSNFIQASLRYLLLFINLYLLLEVFKFLQYAYVRIQKSRIYEIKDCLLRKHNKTLYKEIERKLYHIFKQNFHKNKLFKFYCKINCTFTKFPLHLLKVNLF
jgi:hypothetical protein